MGVFDQKVVVDGVEYEVTRAVKTNINQLLKPYIGILVGGGEPVTSGVLESLKAELTKVSKMSGGQFKKWKENFAG